MFTFTISIICYQILNSEYYLEYSLRLCYKTNMNIQTSESEDLRQQILDAAENRFRVYGYGKTTMAEIAGDVSMSAANLYRYFKNKQDIAAECACQCMSQRVDKLREIIRVPGLTAVEKLHAFVQGVVEHALEGSEKQPKINEMIDDIARDHAQIVHRDTDAQCALIAEILAFGNQTGEFEVDDLIGTSKTVFTTLTLFEVPSFVPMYTPEQFVSMAKGVVDLLIKGLAKR